MRAKQTLIGAAQLGAAALAVRMLNLLVLVIIAREAGRVMLGDYVVATAAGAFAFVLCDLGLGQRLAREGAARPEELTPLSQNSFLIKRRLATVAMLAICLWVSVRIWQGSGWLLIGSILLAFVIQSLAYGYECLGRAASRMDIEAWSTTLSGLTFSMITCVGLLLWQAVPSIVAGALLSACVRLVVARALCSTLTEPSGDQSRDLLKALKEALPYSITTLLQVAFVQIDVLIIGLITSSSFVGAYAMISRPLLALGSLASYAANSLIPGLARMSVTDRARAVRLWRRGSLAALGCGATACVIAISVGESAMRVLYGNEFQDSFGEPWRLASLFLVVSVFNGASGAMLTAVGLQSLRGVAAVAGVLATVGLCVTLVPTHGLNGSALQFAASESVVAAVLVAGGIVFTRRRLSA